MSTILMNRGAALERASMMEAHLRVWIRVVSISFQRRTVLRATSRQLRHTFATFDHPLPLAGTYLRRAAINFAKGNISGEPHLETFIRGLARFDVSVGREGQIRVGRFPGQQVVGYESAPMEHSISFWYIKAEKKLSAIYTQRIEILVTENIVVVTEEEGCCWVHFVSL